MGIGKVIDALLDRIRPVIAATVATPPPVLYHYTRLPGLLGIVKSRALWATDIRYLNDEKEFQYALELTKNLLTSLRDSDAPPAYAPLIPTLLAAIDALDSSGVYVSCFTENGDLLSQWRGYCGSEAGCSIGWPGAALRKSGERAGFFLAKCIYEPDLQRNLVLDVLDRAFARKPDLSSSHASSLFSVALSMVAPLLKHPSFHEEAEWRLFSAHRISKQQPLGFRPGRASIIPYVEVRLEDEEGHLTAIQRLIVGPTPLPLLSAQAIQSCLSAAGASAHKVVVSAAPYRSV
jgi:hypothetical protein